MYCKIFNGIQNDDDDGQDDADGGDEDNDAFFQMLQCLISHLIIYCNTAVDNKTSPSLLKVDKEQKHIQFFTRL